MQQEIGRITREKGFTLQPGGAVSGQLYGLPFSALAGAVWSVGVTAVEAPEGAEYRVRELLKRAFPTAEGLTVRWEKGRLAVTMSPAEKETSAAAFFALIEEAVGLASALSAPPVQIEDEKPPADAVSHPQERAAWLRGAAGAILGALAGVLPWLLMQLAGGLSLGLLCFLMPVASFAGYRWFHGPRRLKTVRLTVALPSFLLLLPAAFLGCALYWRLHLVGPGTFWQVLVTPVVAAQSCAGALVGAATAVLGMIFLNRPMREYVRGSSS
ncbi:MAG: hypothetical protein HFJ80_06670 [Clostridiales bacterium]|nr:hypothetical protein [Clostridiales bacterium]